MQYKVIVVTAGQASCCGTPPTLDQEVEDACNQMAADGWILVAAYPEAVNVCEGCVSQTKRASFLIFGHE